MALTSLWQLKMWTPAELERREQEMLSCTFAPPLPFPLHCVIFISESHGAGTLH